MYQAIFISDIHLGSSFNKSRKIFELLECIEAKKIFLVGDIINTPSPNDHPHIIKFITLLQSKPWEIIYISGNHEEDRTLPPISMDFNKKLFSKKRYIYKSNHHNIYLEHGHDFHQKNRFNLMMKKFIRYWRLKKNHIAQQIKKRDTKAKPKNKDFYYHILKPIAQKLLIHSFRYYMISSAKENLCNIVICGHFHIPEDKIIKGIRYLNCGDWVENSSFIVEDMNGEFFLKQL